MPYIFLIMRRSQGFLTDGQREALQGEQQRNQAERQMRSRVRKQVRNALVIDAPILLDDLRSRDREQIFRSKNRDPKEQAEMAGEERTEERKAEHMEAVEVEPGAAALLAFLYEGLEDRSINQRMGDFEDVLRTAMERVAKRNGWTVDKFKFTIEFDRDPEFETMKERFNDREATIEEATTLVQHDLIRSEEFAEYINSHRLDSK